MWKMILLDLCNELGEDNLVIGCTGSRENNVGSVGRDNNNNNPKFPGRHI